LILADPKEGAPSQKKFRCTVHEARVIAAAAKRAGMSEQDFLLAAALRKAEVGGQYPLLTAVAELQSMLAVHRGREANPDPLVVAKLDELIAMAAAAATAELPR
jgi:hypothetical protein